MRMRSAAAVRPGLTLLEVVVSMAIFLMSLVAIYQLVLLGSDRAMDVKLQSRTSMRCQAKLDELMIGAENLGSTGYTNFTDTVNSDMQWKAEATQNDAAGLWNVKVWVKIELPTGKVVESQLCRMMLDPSIRGSTMDQPNPTPASTTPTTDPTTPPDPSAGGGAAAPAAAAPKQNMGNKGNAGGGAKAGNNAKTPKDG